MNFCGIICGAKRGNIMAQYYVQGETIKIDTNKKDFASGSEGRLFLIKGKLYKIYHPTALNEGFGNKKNYHQSLLGLSEKFQHFILPQDLIFDMDGNYAGYVTELVDKKKKKDGVTELEWDKFISNIKNIEIETNMLSQNRFLLVDLGYHNSIYSKEQEKLCMIDPGRYHHYSYFTLSDYKRQNKIILTDYFKQMLKMDIYYFKLMNKTKIFSLVNTMSEEIGDRNYSDYFEEQSEKYDSVHEFFKSKGRFVK